MIIPEVVAAVKDWEEPETLLQRSKGFPRLWANDPEMLGYVENVNRAVGLVETPWALLWNDDAYPLFKAEDLAAVLETLPETVQCAAPAKRIREGEVLQRWHHVEYISESTSNKVDPAIERVHTHCFVSDFGARWVALERSLGSSSPMLWLKVMGTSYCPLFAVRTDWFHSLGGFSTMYSPGYYEDAHFWRLTRRLGGETVVLLGMEYEHEGRGTFKKVYDNDSLSKHLDENLGRYLRVWGGGE